MIKKIFRKLFPVLASLLIAVQPLTPIAGFVSDAYAQEAPPTSEILSPIPDPMVAEPSPEPGPSPSVEPEIASEPSPSIEQTFTPEASPSPGPTPSASVEESTSPAVGGNLEGEILQNTSAASAEEVIEAEGITAAEIQNLDPTVITDKADYAPTDAVVVTGTNFSANTTYTIYITSVDNYSFITSVTTDDHGSFTYIYQLDGTTRPTYTVQIKDATGNVVAATTFTDPPPPSGPSGTDFSQCSNKNPTLGSCKWIGSIVQSSNSQYFEGMTVPQRLLFRDTQIADGVHHVTFTYQYTKAGIHAYDFLTTVNPTTPTVQGNTPPETLNPCTDLGGADTTACNALNPSVTAPKASITVPSDPFDSKDSAPGVGTGSSQSTKETNYETANGGAGSRKITVYAPTAGAFSSPSMTLTHSPSTADSDTGDTDVAVDITFTSSGCGTGSGCNYLLYFGGHLALTGANNSTGSNWGPGLGSSQISGGPYHIKSVKFDGSGGSLDNQIKGADILVPPGSISLDKVTVPGGDPTSFGFTTTNLPAPTTPSLTDASTPQVWTSLANGTTYTITESVPGGWSLTGRSCTGASTSVVTNITNGVSIALAAGDNIVCTFTNTLQQAHLTLVKTVTNDNGGTALNTAWTLSASGPTPISGATGTGTVTGAAVNAGAYTLSESGGPSGYTASTYSCVNNGGAPVVSNSITLAAGDTATCTINNNDDAAHLIVIKHVVNDNGGTKVASDFSTTISSVTTATPTAAGVESPGVNNTLTSVGSYSVDEGAHVGYDKTLSADCSGSIALGQTKTCTITNDDQAAHLIVIKHVINDNGGTKVASNFTMHITGTAGTANFAGAESPGTNTQVNAGTFSVTEDSLTGYSSSTSGDCSGTIANGETKTCTVTNNDQAATLTVIKHVINDNGGTAVASDFTLDSGGTNDSPDNFAGNESGTDVTLDAGSYSVTETGPSGYTESDSADCSGTIVIGEHKTCTVTNNDKAAHLIVIKHVINDNGGTALAADFTLDSGGANDTPDDFAGAESPGTNVTLDAGSYNVTELGPSGYSASFSADCSGSIAIGETKTCTVTNDDVSPQLIVIKHVINNNGGTAVASDFSLDSGGSNDSPDNFAGEEAPGTTVTLNAGAYNVTESGPSGYTASFSSDCSGSIAVGQTKTCTVTNNDIAPQLIVIKHVINDNGGTATAADFTLDSGGTNDSPDDFAGAESPGTTVTLNAGSFNVTETGPSGYTQSNSADCSGTIAVGQTKTCTVTNDDQQAYIKVVKVVTNDNGGSAAPDDFDLTLEGDAVLSEALTPVDPGTYTAGETLLDGYTFEGFSGDCDDNGDTTVALGETKTCTLTNNDIAPQLIVIKHVINDNGDVAAASDFTMDVTATNPSDDLFPGAEDPGTTITLDAGSYSVDETANNGYIKTLSADCTGTIAVGETKTCTITNNDTPHATRTQGFWQTHTTYTSGVFNLGPWTIGTHVIDTNAELFAGFYASISKTTTGAKRSQLDQARMQLLQQWLAAKLNCAAFGCSAATQTLLTNAAAAFAGTNRSLILSFASQLDTYNNSNDALPILGQGKATPKASQALATLIFWDALP